MSWVTTVLQAISALTGFSRATTRLLEAAKDTEPALPKLPPAPPPLRSAAPDALSYMQGRAAEQHKQAQRERLQWSTKRLHEQAAAEEPIDSEQPSDEAKP